MPLLMRFYMRHVSSDRQTPARLTDSNTIALLNRGFAHSTAPVFANCRQLQQLGNAQDASVSIEKKTRAANKLIFRLFLFPECAPDLFICIRNRRKRSCVLRPGSKFLLQFRESFFRNLGGGPAKTDNVKLIAAPG